MQDTNTITIIGSLTREPQRVPGAKPQALFWLCSNRKWTDANGAERTDTLRIGCRCFAHSANSILKHGKQGTRLIVQGVLRLESWTGGDGSDQSGHVVFCETVGFLSGSDLKTAPSRAEIDDPSAPQ